MTAERNEAQLDTDWRQRMPRVLAGLALAGGLGFAAFWAFIIGAVLTTGCFFTCEEPNPLAGVPILVLSGVLAGGAVGAAAWSVTTVSIRWTARVIALPASVVGVVVALILVAAN